MSDLHSHVSFQAPPIHELAPLFPGYAFETLIATGGMGAVYRAVQKSLDRTVAIKILPQEFSKDAAFCAGFEAEAKAMARLNHPNLIGVYDFGEVKGMLYIVMEYVPGESLFDAAHGRAIDSSEVIRLVTGICEGLAHAHENGILHRDIKPSNILLDLDARPKIGDFGLARPIDRKVQEGEEIFGTPHYTAPEVVSAPHTVTNRADIFSVGVMLHELLTGKLPADDRRPASAIIQCDPRFDAIIRRATHPMQEARYASASEITRELAAIASSAGPRVLRTAVSHAAPRPAVAPGRRLATPQSSSSGGLVLFMVVLAALAAAAFLFLRQKPAEMHDKPPAPPPANVGGTERPPAPAPKPEPKPEPEPGPVPVVTPDPEPEPGPVPEPAEETDRMPEPAPDPEVPAQPKFDVPAFFERARKIMGERAAPLIATHGESLAKNLTAFERAAKRIVRRIEGTKARDLAEETLESFIESCQEGGNRLPAKLDTAMLAIRDLKDLHEEHVEAQESIDGVLLQALNQLSSLYILGIEKQIERLKADNDPAAILLLEEEIRKTRQSETYFPALMLGKDPEKVDDEEEKADKDAPENNPEDE